MTHLQALDGMISGIWQKALLAIYGGSLHTSTKQLPPAYGHGHNKLAEHRICRRFPVLLWEDSTPLFYGI